MASKSLLWNFASKLAILSLVNSVKIFTDLTRDELLALPRPLTIFIFAFGGLEQHGPHLPLGTRWILAANETRLLAERLQNQLSEWNVVLMPALPITADAHTSSIAFPVRAHVVRDYLVDQCKGLQRLGFTKFAALTTHLCPRQLCAIEDAGKIISTRKWIFWGEKSQFVSISSAEPLASDIMRSPMIANPKEHGGARDTGLMLAFAQNKVSTQFSTQADRISPPENFARFWAYFTHRWSGGWGEGENGYWGKPKEANAERAKTDLIEQLDKTALLLKTVFQQNQGQGLFRSGYRYFFVNGSFFKAYMLAAVFFILMLVWTLWSLKDVFEA